MKDDLVLKIRTSDAIPEYEFSVVLDKKLDGVLELKRSQIKDIIENLTYIYNNTEVKK